jgi:regulator of RNase E activity RraA
LDRGSQIAGRIKTMEVVQAELETHADIIAKNVDGKAVLLVKVQAEKSEYKSIQHFIKTWQTRMW